MSRSTTAVIVFLAVDLFDAGEGRTLVGCSEKPENVYRRRPGNDELIGTDKRVRFGRFAVPASPAPGSFYAFAKPVQAGQLGICGRARSRLVRG